MSSIMRRRSGLTPSFVIAKAPVCCVDDSQTQPDRQVASLHKPSAPISTGINAAIHGLYRASGSVQSIFAPLFLHSSRSGYRRLPALGSLTCPLIPAPRHGAHGEFV